MTTSPSVRGSDPVVEAGRPSIVPGSGPLAAFTIDVEDWYQSSVDFDAPISERVVGVCVAPAMNSNSSATSAAIDSSHVSSARSVYTVVVNEL